MFRSLFICLFSLFATTALTATGDPLFVVSKIVNMRAGPSTDDEVLLKLRHGRKLEELQRQGNWVEVDTGREDIPSGWIYARLLSPEPAAGTPAEQASGEAKVESLFDLFELALAELNARIKTQIGFTAFSKAEDLERGQIKLTATREWVALSRLEREAHLSEAFKIWAAAVGEGVSITLHVVDQQGERFMTMLR